MSKPSEIIAAALDAKQAPEHAYHMFVNMADGPRFLGFVPSAAWADGADALLASKAISANKISRAKIDGDGRCFVIAH